MCSNRLHSSTFGHPLVFRESFIYAWLEIWDNLYTPSSRYLLWFAHFGMENLRSAQLLSCNISCTLLIIQVIRLVESIYEVIGHDIFLCIPSFNCFDLEIQRITHAICFLETSHVPCFKILQLNLIFNIKLVHENSTTNIE